MTPSRLLLFVLTAAIVGCGAALPDRTEVGSYAWRHWRSMDGVTLPSFPADSARSCWVLGKC